jgi:RimJ/RimL family protein N-acetyltransferase
LDLLTPKPVRTLTPPNPPLHDDVVLLRPPEPADAAALLPIRSEEDTRRWMLWDDEPPPDHAEILANIERARQSWAAGTWAVFVITVDGTVVGGANLGFYEHDIAEGSYFLAQAARGKGYATRTLRLLARWAFEENGIERLELRVDPRNEASIRLAERVGFMREGIERASRRATDGSRFDSVVFSLLPGEL